MTYSNSDKKMEQIFFESGYTYKQKCKTLNNLRARLQCNDSSLSGLLTFVPHEVVKDESIHNNKIAFTNGNKMFFGDKFFSAPIPIQSAIILHEMFHIVFRHISRSRNRIFRLFTLCNDAIINDSIGYRDEKTIDNNKSIYLYKDHCVSLDSIYKSFNIPYDKQRPLYQWTSEALYHEVIKSVKEDLEKKKQQQGKGEDQEGNSTSSENSSGSKSENSPGSSSRKSELEILEDEINRILDELAEKHKLYAGGDIIDDPDNIDPVNEEVNDTMWTQLYNRAKDQARGSNNSILGKIAPDIYKPQISWEKQLRKFLRKRCMPLTETAWSRPSRRVASYRIHGNKTYLPGIVNKKGLDKMVIILDVSGSCFNEQELSMFCTEVQSVQDSTGVEIALIFADTDIRGEYIVRSDGKKLLTKIKEGIIKIEGGGGTDMVKPFLESKKKYNPHLVIICSDGYTPTPTRKEIQGTHLIWILNTDQKLPKEAGRVLRIKPIFNN